MARRTAVPEPAPAPAGPASDCELKGVLDVSGAIELQRSLLALADQSLNVTLDLSAVTEIDGAALQLLSALERTVRRRGGSFHASGACESVAATLTRAGCAHWHMQKES